MRLAIIKRILLNFIKRTETIVFLIILAVFTPTLFCLPENETLTTFLFSINTSLWAALFFYMVFNLYSQIETQSSNLELFKEMMNRKIKEVERIFQNYIDEVVDYDSTIDLSNQKGFFNIVSNLPVSHTPQTNSLRMVSQTTPSPSGLQFTYVNIQESCIYNFDRLVKSFAEIERLALSLQLRYIDPKLYEKIFALIDTKPITRNILMRNQSTNPHAALAGDIDALVSRLRTLIVYLNNEFGLSLKMRSDLK